MTDRQKNIKERLHEVAEVVMDEFDGLGIFVMVLFDDESGKEMLAFETNTEANHLRMRLKDAVACSLSKDIWSN